MCVCLHKCVGCWICEWVCYVGVCVDVGVRVYSYVWWERERERERERNRDRQTEKEREVNCIWTVIHNLYIFSYNYQLNYHHFINVKCIYMLNSNILYFDLHFILLFNSFWFIAINFRRGKKATFEWMPSFQGTSFPFLLESSVLKYEEHTISFQTFFVSVLLLIWNSSPLRSNLLRLQCICCTVPTTSGMPHRSPLVWACQWP